MISNVHCQRLRHELVVLVNDGLERADRGRAVRQYHNRTARRGQLRQDLATNQHVELAFGVALMQPDVELAGHARRPRHGDPVDIFADRLVALEADAEEPLDELA